MDSMNSLREEFSRARKAVADLASQYRHIGNQLEEKRAELRVMDKWLRNPPEFLTPSRRSDLLSPTEAVDELVVEIPGLKRKAVIDRLEEKVDSDSPNIRSMISSAISRRIKAGDIVQTDDKRLFPKGHESVAVVTPEVEPAESDDDDGLPF